MPAELVELNHVLTLRPVPLGAHMGNHAGMVAVGGQCLNSISNLKQCRLLLLRGFVPSSTYLLYTTEAALAHVRSNYFRKGLSKELFTRP